MDVSRIMRWRATTLTWCKKSTALLTQEAARARTEEERWLAGYEAANLLRGALFELESVVRLLPEDLADEVERYAKDLARSVKSHRLSGKLARVEGRTPEEAEAFRTKALSLAGEQ